MLSQNMVYSIQAVTRFDTDYALKPGSEHSAESTQHDGSICHPIKGCGDGFAPEYHRSGRHRRSKSLPYGLIRIWTWIMSDCNSVKALPINGSLVSK